MFTKIGESKWMKFVLFITTFAFVGTALVALIVYKMSGKIAGAAEVNGMEISMQRYMYEVNLIQKNLESQGIDTAPLRKMIHRQALDNIINEELVYQEAEKEGLTATKEEVKEAILNIPAFQENGVFSKEKYLAIINSMGISPQFFEEILRRQLSQEHIFSLIEGATYLTKEEISPILQRELSIITGKLLLITPKVSVSEKELKDYYEKNKKQFAGEKGKKIVLYRIDIKKLGKVKAGELAKKVFLSMKNNKQVEEEEGLNKIFEGVLYSVNNLKDIPDEVKKDIQTLSKEKNISFVKTEDAYYLAQFFGETVKPLPFEKVKEKVSKMLKKEKYSKALVSLRSQIKKDLEKGLSFKQIKEKYKGKVEKIEKMKYRELISKYRIPEGVISLIFKTEKGLVKEPFLLQDKVGLIFIEKIEKDTDNQKNLENLIKDALFKEKTGDLISMYILKLRQKADIKINPRLNQ